MATINGMDTMTNITYHEEQAAYNMRNLANEIQKEFSLGADEKIDLNDPRYKEFTEHNPYVSRWYGGMAKELGVEGQIVTLESFKNVNLGFAPNSKLNDTPRALNSNPVKLDENGIPLPAEQQSKDRIASIEMIFTQPKSLSIAFSVMSKQDEIALKKRLNDILIHHIVPAIEEDAILRKGKDGIHKQKGSGLLFTWFNHTENRGVADEDGNVKVEPHDHIHFDIINSVMDENGELYSLFNTMIFANKMKYESIWQLELIKVLQEFGFELEQTHLKEEQNNPFIPDSEKVVHAFEVAGIPEEIVQYYLKRSLEIAQEVEKYKQELSNSSELRNSNSTFLCELNQSNSSLCAEMTEIARKETRHNKTELSPSEIKTLIQAEVKEKFNFDLSDIERIRTYKQKGINQKHKVPTEEQLMEGLHRQYKKVEITESQFRAYIIKQTALYLSKDECEQLATKIFLNQSKMILDKEQYVYYEKLIKNDPSLSDYDKEQLRFQFDRDVRFTSNYMLNLDRSIIEGFEQRIHEEKFVFPPQLAQAKIREFEVRKGFNFSTDQRNAIEMCLTNKGAIVNIAGRAGSGKSTLLECVKEKYQEGGFNVWGTSVSSTATDGLQQSTNLDKDKCFNTSELLFKLKEGKISFNEKTVLIIDEAGFIDSLTMRKLSQAINAAGGKIIACGESQQLQAIGASGIFNTITDKFQTAEIKSINRQRDEWQKEMVEDFASGHAAKGITALHDAGRINISDKDSERISRIAQDYLADSSEFSKKMIITNTNKDCEAINNKVREILKEKGSLSKEEFAKVDCGDGVQREFAKGDRIVVTKNFKEGRGNKQVKLCNNMAGEIVGITTDRNNNPILEIKFDSLPHPIQVKAQEGLQLNHSYSVTTYKSQGATVENTYLYVSNTMNDLHSAYVQVSRHKGNTSMYLSNEMVENTLDKLDNLEPTKTQLKYARDIAKKNNLELTLEQQTEFRACRDFLNAHSDRALSLNSHLIGGAVLPSALEDFITITDAMGRANYKRTTYDFQVIEQERSNLERIAYKEYRDKYDDGYWKVLKGKEMELGSRTQQAERAIPKKEAPAEADKGTKKPLPKLIPKWAEEEEEWTM